jgi:hypothetical protein
MHGRGLRRKRRDMRARFWPRNLKGRGHLEDVDLDGRIIYAES